jgi:hypothetical protein
MTADFVPIVTVRGEEGSWRERVRVAPARLLEPIEAAAWAPWTT